MGRKKENINGYDARKNEHGSNGETKTQKGLLPCTQDLLVWRKMSYGIRSHNQHRSNKREVIWLKECVM